jgi:hypothetical protein
MAAQLNHAMIGFVIRLQLACDPPVSIDSSGQAQHGSGFVAMMEELSGR